MRPILTFTVTHPLPAPLSRLYELAHNLYWVWNPTIREFLRSIDPQLWHSTNHHALKVLSSLSAKRLQELAADPQFLERYQSALAELDAYLAQPGWYQTEGRGERKECIAYLSAEFGLHESIPLYSGGLGVLSGDHTKSASDLKLPFVCVGLMYQLGYFQQRLANDGTQLESYTLNDTTLLPVSLVSDEKHRPIRISVEYPKGPVFAQIWKLSVGAVPIYLLDTNIRENTIPEYRDIGDYLYGGDQETRIMQEIMLGIGGMRALRAMGLTPTVTHSNEGHSAFLMLERIRTTMAELGMSFAEAAELVAAGSAFTTHTPVPAGNDVFSVEQIERYFSGYWPQLGLSREQFLALGRIDPANASESFHMPVLALRLTSQHNGVSQLHGEVSQQMWEGVWPNVPRHENPIVGITNGVHTLTWIADEMRDLLGRYFGTDWHQRIADPATWAAVDAIPNHELWRLTNTLRQGMIEYLRWRLDEQITELYAGSPTGRNLDQVLDPNALTIGFARRFATYKRATLLFRDPERAARLFNNPERPVQMVVAGKAHPKDAAGKEFIRQLIQIAHQHGLEGKVIFVEDYDMALGRRLVQGCDVWLNNPRRPLEASGTSGMKAAINGTLNVSILDGWFPEAYDGKNGFQIGDVRGLHSTDAQDEIESRHLYRVLENQVVPCFFDRDPDGIPHRWVEMQKHALKTMAPQFSSDRMVAEYATRFYFPSSDRYARLRANNRQAVRQLIVWKRWIAEQWGGVSVLQCSAELVGNMKIGDTLRVTATIALGQLSPKDLLVEAYYGNIDPEGLIADGEGAPLTLQESGSGVALYEGLAPLTRPGLGGLTVRVIPYHPDLAHKFEMKRVTFAPVEAGE